ncbi:hypothetical protein PV516_19190 [Streptomyces scabiei]|uniref:hypothetical protein n=1 Tax=Streptomyces scabiei TaxID=1930 RepID=UPI0029A8CC17|nr:hypothetical protein [Streptomyces scabiei]MDX3165914.1 hypothetical protein [Streptomyces scabiei]
MTTVVTLSFTRPVHAHELRPGDVFAFTSAPRTALTVVNTGQTAVSAELTLSTLTLAGLPEPLRLPSSLHLHALRMVRTVSMKCLLCGKNEGVEVNLPEDGEPLTFVCDGHDLGTEPAPATA